MSKYIRMFAVTLAVFAGVFSSSALAWSPLSNIPCGQASTSAVCKDRAAGSQDPLTGKDGLLMKITDLIALIAGVAAVIIIVLAGLRFVTAGGSSEDIAGARRTLIYAVIGLIIIVVGRALIRLILSRL